MSALRSPSVENPAAPRARRAAAALAGLCLLAGCADRNSIVVGSVPDDYRTRHPIVVGEAEEAIEIPVVSTETRLTRTARDRVRDFAGRFRSARASTIRMLLPVGAANSAAAEAASRDVVAVLRRAGIAGERILVQPYAPGEGGDFAPIRLVYATLAARTAPCGHWPEDLGETTENRNYYNFGCASQQNLAAQVADPRDLLGPRGLDPVDAEQRTNMLDRYRQGKVTAADPSPNSIDYTY